MDGPKAVFSSRYAGSVDYYAAMLHFGSVAIDYGEHYDKRNKHLNRMDIVGTNGLQSLSASLVKPNSQMRVEEVELSGHGNWRHNHWGALFSAYGRTPYFDYFADDLKRIYSDESILTIASLNEAIHCAVVDFLDLPLESYHFPGDSSHEALNWADLRDSKLKDSINGYGCKEYYQIWQPKHGFQPSLSILDLLFNMGREAIFYLVQIGR